MRAELCHQSVLKKGNKLGVEVEGITECSKNRLAEAWELFIAVDNARALVASGVGAVQGGAQKNRQTSTRQ